MKPEMKNILAIMGIILLIAGAAWSLILRRKRSNRSNFTRDLGRKK